MEASLEAQPVLLLQDTEQQQQQQTLLGCRTKAGEENIAHFINGQCKH